MKMINRNVMSIVAIMQIYLGLVDIIRRLFSGISFYFIVSLVFEAYFACVQNRSHIIILSYYMKLFHDANGQIKTGKNRRSRSETN